MLNNDSDPDGDDLTIKSFTHGAHGKVSRGSNGELIYIPDDGFFGQDSFTYVISDGSGGSDEATVSITVKRPTDNGHVNSAPVAKDDHASTACRTPVTLTLLDNDTDADNDILEILKVSGVDNGIVEIVGINKIIFTPTACGLSETFTYTVADGNGGTDTATVTINVAGETTQNVAPDAVDDSVSTDMGSPVTIDVLQNDRDADNDDLSIKTFSQPANGMVIIANNKLVYKPNDKFMGTDKFTYTISDGNGHTAVANVTVTVGDTGCTADCTVAKPDKVTTTEGVAVQINPLANDSGSGLKIGDIDDPAHGTVTRVGNSIKYTPVAGFTGTDSFWYQIIDASGYKDSAEITVIVTSNGTGGGKENVAPTAVNDTATTVQGEAIDVNVLENDFDGDGDALTIESYTQAAHGTVSVAGNGSLRYSPRSAYSGGDSFEYTIVDGKGHSATATVSLTVTATATNPDPIVVKNDTASTTENKGILIDVLANDSKGLTITKVNPSANSFAEVVNGQISYLPNTGFSGVDTISYDVKDAFGQTAHASVKITVTKVVTVPNRAPDAVEDAPTTDINTAITVDVLSNDTDPDGDALRITKVTQPQQGRADIVNNKIVYTPNGTVGSMSMTYTISDGHGHTDSAVLTIAVTNPNDGNIHWPVIKNENVTVRIGESILVDVLANDTDLDGDTLILDEVDSGSFGIVEKVNGKIRYTSVSELGLGTDTIYYGVHDGHGHNGSGILTVTVVD